MKVGGSESGQIASATSGGAVIGGGRRGDVNLADFVIDSHFGHSSAGGAGDGGSAPDSLPRTAAANRPPAPSGGASRGRSEVPVRPAAAPSSAGAACRGRAGAAGLPVLSGPSVGIGPFIVDARTKAVIPLGSEVIGLKMRKQRMDAAAAAAAAAAGSPTPPPGSAGSAGAGSPGSVQHDAFPLDEDDQSPAAVETLAAGLLLRPFVSSILGGVVRQMTRTGTALAGGAGLLRDGASSAASSSPNPFALVAGAAAAAGGALHSIAGGPTHSDFVSVYRLEREEREALERSGEGGGDSHGAGEEGDGLLGTGLEEEAASMYGAPPQGEW